MNYPTKYPMTRSNKEPMKKLVKQPIKPSGKRLDFIRNFTRILALAMLLIAVLVMPVYAAGEHGADGHSDEEGIGHGDEANSAGSGSEHGDEHADEHADEHDGVGQGPHGGRLLIDGDISVELLLSGHGDGPGYEAWILRNGKPVTDRNAILNAEFMRLDGETLGLDFAYEGQSWHGTQSVEEPHSFDVTMDLAIGSEHHQWTFGSYEGRAEIAAATALKAGVKSDIADSGPINQTLTVYGRTFADPAKVSHLRARFPGTITQINANIGDQVKAGQVMAEIESSENLRRYNLKSPMTGIVIARDGNPGELALQQALLTIANYDTLWVEFQIFPGQANKVAAGQTVSIFGEHQEAQSSIQHILPSDNGQPYLRARVPLNNTDGQWAPGLMLSGSIATRQTDVPLRVKYHAVQQMDGQDVVFIQFGDAYEARAVTLGITDGEYIEIVDGLRPGVLYVSENSYLIKADLEKSGAAHNH